MEESGPSAGRDVDHWHHSAHAHHDVEVRSTSRVIYDVTGLLEPIENIEIENEVALAAMTEDNLIDQYIARQG